MKRNLTKPDFHRESFRNAFMKVQLVLAFLFIGVVTPDGRHHHSGFIDSGDAGSG